MQILRRRLSKKRILTVITFSLVSLLVLVGNTSVFLFGVTVGFVLFLPGFSLLQAIVSDEFDFLERLILSPMVGIAFISLLAMYLSFVSVPINRWSVILSILLFSIPLLAYSWKRQGSSHNEGPSSYATSTCFVLLLLIAVSFVCISWPFSQNGILLPVGDDPPTHTLVATMIAQEGRIPESWTPYFPEQSTFTYPPGYPSVIAFLSLLNPLWMPALVVLFSTSFAMVHAGIFVLAFRLSNDRRVALCSATLSALLSFGFYQMISKGRFPQLTGLMLTLGFFVFSYAYVITKKRRLSVLAGTMLASLFLTYSVSFITAVAGIMLFFSLALVFLKNKKTTLLGLLSIVVVGMVFSSPRLLNTVNRLIASVPAREYEALLEWFDMYSVESVVGYVNLPMYHGFWISIFGMIGVPIIIRRRRVGAFLLFAWFLSIFLVMLNELFRVHFPGWYYLQSGYFLNPTLSLPLSVLAGLGFIGVYDLIRNKLRNSSHRLHGTLHILIVSGLLLSAVIFEVNTNTIWMSEFNQFTHFLREDRISTADYNAMMWISNNTTEDAVIFNDHWVGTPSIWIPVICHRRIIMPLLSISEVGWTDIMFTRQDESLIIARNPSSTEALSILKQYDVTYIFLSNTVSSQVEAWRKNFDANLFINSPHYELEFNEDEAWVIRVVYSPS